MHVPLRRAVRNFTRNNSWKVMIAAAFFGSALTPVKHRELTTQRSITPRAKAVDVDLAPPTKRVPPKAPEGEYPWTRNLRVQCTSCSLPQHILPHISKGVYNFVVRRRRPSSSAPRLGLATTPKPTQRDRARSFPRGAQSHDQRDLTTSWNRTLRCIRPQYLTNWFDRTICHRQYYLHQTLSIPSLFTTGKMIYLSSQCLAKRALVGNLVWLRRFARHVLPV